MLIELVTATALPSKVMLRREYRPPQNWRRVVVLGLLERGRPYLLFSFGLNLTSASNAALMPGLLCGFVVVLAAVFLHQRAGWSIIPALLLAVVGLIVLDGGATDSGAPGVGDLLIVAGALSAALPPSSREDVGRRKIR